MSWRQWRAKHMTTCALYPIAARVGAFTDHVTGHAVYSPDPDTITSKQDLVRAATHARSAAREAGYTGGAIVFHPFRVSAPADTAFTEYITGTEYETTATDVLLWEWLRTTGDDWQTYTTWSPHFHILGIRPPDTSDNPHYTGPGILKHLRTIPDHDSLVDTITAHRPVVKDMLDHVGLFTANPEHPLSWFDKLTHETVPTFAKQYVSDARLDNIREILINGPTTETNLTN